MMDIFIEKFRENFLNIEYFTLNAKDFKFISGIKLYQI